MPEQMLFEEGHAGDYTGFAARGERVEFELRGNQSSDKFGADSALESRKVSFLTIISFGMGKKGCIVTQQLFRHLKREVSVFFFLSIRASANPSTVVFPRQNRLNRKKWVVCNKG